MHIEDDWKNDYVLVYKKSIGQGTFGEVYLVRSKTNNKYYAMKQINLDQYILKSSIINKSYALDEGLKLIKLNIDHENIVKYYKSYIKDNCIYWIMEYCDGGTLRDRIQLYTKRKKHMEENLIWYWALQILRGIKYLHDRGIIHRDLKPDNIYIHGKLGICKIGDFGFSKLLVESPITDNQTIRFISDDDDDDYYHNDEYYDTQLRRRPSTRRHSQLEEPTTVYKLVNMSQVGTPSYIAPELRSLVDSHLNYSSIDTINKAIKFCERNVYKGDIFSFGCILYELAFLKIAFDNRFQLPSEVFTNTKLKIDSDNNFRSNFNYSDDLIQLIKICLNENADERYCIKKLFELPSIKNRLNKNYFEYYKNQIVPTLAINLKHNGLICIKSELGNTFKPIAMKSLRQNLIIILANKHVQNSRNSLNNNANLNSKSASLNEYESQTVGKSNYYYNYFLSSGNNEVEISFFVYNEFGNLLKTIDSFVIVKNDTESMNDVLSFKANDFCIDEDRDHLYLSTENHGILRFIIGENDFYFDYLKFDGKLDLSELVASQASDNNSVNCFPTCLTLIENETLFKDSIQTTNKRRLAFYDRISKRIVTMQVDINSPTNCNSLENSLIKCYLNAGLTLDQIYIRQMVCTSKELICLFDDLDLINVYNIKTLQLERTNNLKVNKSALKNILCLTLDSEDNLYSTDGKSIFNLDCISFKYNWRKSPQIKKGENLAHTISWMTILTNAKLVLLTDAIQMENSVLFILKPVSYTKT